MDERTVSIAKVS